MKKNPRIAVVSAADPRDRRTWSGSTFFMSQALERHAGQVDFIGPLSIPCQKYREGFSRILFKAFGKRSYPTRSRGAAKIFAKEIAHQLSQQAYDLIFAPAASVEIAMLNTALPVVYASDATFALMQEVYPIFSAMHPRTVKEEERFEAAAIAKADLLLYPSEWAAASAIADYGADPARVCVVPFGANLDEEPPRSAVVGKTVEDRVRILFLAKEWQRKGGAVAVDTLKALQHMGVDAELTICGVIPPGGLDGDGINVVPYLDKNKPADRQRFEEILLRSHILLLPTVIECYGVVFCEANAYGMPVFAKRVGGIPTIVRDGENGYLLPPDANGEDFARAIAGSLTDPDAYAALNRGARKRYEAVLNWNAWGRQVSEAIKGVLSR